jgi:isoleucyl-tRNA synthetase
MRQMDRTKEKLADYKDTLNLPQTIFPMKGNLREREPEILGWWESVRAYDKLQEMRAGSPRFVLHDGPPYSNEHIHMGTALNKIVKDFIVRSKSMQGYSAPFLPGWDNHGMPIEMHVMRQFQEKGESPDILAVRKRCREYAAHFVEVQKEEFKMLGVWGEWEQAYLTMSKEYESTIIRTFGELVKKGFIYRGLRPIHWCSTCKTALAEAEIEYREKSSHSITLRFSVMEDPNRIFPEGSPGYVLIWTTTPWTIPANMAVVVHPDYDYSLVEADGSVYLLAEKLVPPVMRALGIEDHRTLRRLKGKDLMGLVFRHPLFGRPSPLFLALHVTLEEGTGVVHTAPGHGSEDFQVGQEEGLEILCPVDEAGRFTKEAGAYEGLRVEESNTLIMEDLAKSGSLLERSEIRHQYPHCWRCKQPLIFRTTVQWFLSVDHGNLRQKALEEIERTEWVPAGSKNRITGMMSSRPDWCLSRQRVWGIGVPVLYCTGCGDPILDASLISHIADIVERDGGDIWFAKDASYFSQGSFTSCPKCGGKSFRKETDILDVWFESGSSHSVVLRESHGLDFPADIYFEGSDQHRGWFNTSLIVAVSTKGRAPYRTVVTHGWILDEKGKAMHKSLGNAVSPLDVMEKSGADILRLWTAANDFRVDIRFSEENIEQIRDVYRRIRNTCRYLLGNLHDFSPEADSVSQGELWPIDTYALHELQMFTRKILSSYENLEFHQVFHLLNNYCTVNLSSLYLDVLKDRLYTYGKKSKARRAAQTVLAQILDALVRIMAPIMPFTSEEVWREIPWGKKGTSVHWELFPKPKDLELDAGFLADWERLLEVRSAVLKCLEKARAEGLIGSSLEAGVGIRTTDEELGHILEKYSASLFHLFIVSDVRLSTGDLEGYPVLVEEAGGKLLVGARRASGTKCARCWNYRTSVGISSEHPHICDKCIANLNEG